MNIYSDYVVHFLVVKVFALELKAHMCFNKVMSSGRYFILIEQMDVIDRCEICMRVVLFHFLSLC